MVTTLSSRLCVVQSPWIDRDGIRGCVNKHTHTLLRSRSLDHLIIVVWKGDVSGQAKLVLHLSLHLWGDGSQLRG